MNCKPSPKFIVDSSVRGKVTLLNPNDITLTDAFEQLSSALAINGFAISKQGDVMVIRNARSIQRDYVEVSATRPVLKPVRMYTWIYTAKNLSAREIFQSIRILTSMYGECSVNDESNQIIFTDFTPSLNRVADLLQEIDKKSDPAVAKLAQSSKKIRAKIIEKKSLRHKDEATAEETEN